MNSKLIVGLVIVGVLAVALIGIVAVSAQGATSTPNITTRNGASYNGFFGWMGRMMGFKGTPYYGPGTSSVPQQPLNITVTDPNTNTTTTYQSYGYGYGYGGCMRGFFP